MLLKTSGDTSFMIRGPTHATQAKKTQQAFTQRVPGVALGVPVGSNTHHAVVRGEL